MAIRIFLNGCTGRMGQVIRRLASESGDLEIVAGSDLVMDPAAVFPIFKQASACDVDFDVIVDFSNPQSLPELVRLMKKTLKPAIICTTGLTLEMKQEIATLARNQAVFLSANMSLGINILVYLARQTAKLLYPDFDLEIIEAHHRHKVDAPSGTAMMIADALNESLDGQLQYVFDRSQRRQKRDPRELGLHALRGGSIVGEHTVVFAGDEETLSIHHSAQSREVFARGALAAARFMPDKPAGLYDMSDLIADTTAPKA